MRTLQKIVIGGLALLVLAAVAPPLVRTTPQTNPVSAPPTTTSQAAALADPAPNKPALTAQERKKILADATKGLEVKRDKIEKITFYSPPGADAPKTHITAYIGLPDSDGPYIRVRAIYLSSDWIFYKKIKVMADDVIILEKQFEHSDVDRDNNGGVVWEVADYTAGLADILALTVISKAKSVTVRFDGDNRRYDHEVTRAEKASLKAVLDAYIDISKKL